MHKICFNKLNIFITISFYLKKNYFYLILLALPSFLFFLYYLLSNAMSHYYLIFSDPSYEYLINSLNLVQQKGYGVGHFDHPGTSVQLIGAVVLKIYSAINIHDTDIVNEVLSKPEKYLFVINNFLVLMNSLALLLLGLFTFSVSNNLSLSVLVQLSSFTSRQCFYGLHIVTPENMMIFVLICFIGILIYYLFKFDVNKSAPLLFIILFSVVCGLGLATKITFFPLIIIPLVIIRGFKNKISFLLFTFIFSLIIVSPALSNYEKFLDWIKKLTINNGRYGYGEPTVINFSVFFYNILRIFSRDVFFANVYFTSLTALIFSRYFSVSYKPEIKSRMKEQELLLGIFLAFTLQIIIVGKHYDQHYLIPSLMLSVTAMLLSVSLISKTSIINNKLNKKYYFLIALIISFSTLQFVSYYNEISIQKTEAASVDNFIKSNYSGELIIPALGVANIESSLAFTTYYSGSQTSKYRNSLSQILSSHIFYDEWTRQLYPISEEIKIKDEILKRKKIILQIGNYGSLNIHEFIGTLKKTCSLENITYKKTFSNVYGESVIEIYLE